MPTVLQTGDSKILVRFTNLYYLFLKATDAGGKASAMIWYKFTDFQSKKIFVRCQEVK